MDKKLNYDTVINADTLDTTSRKGKPTTGDTTSDKTDHTPKNISATQVLLKIKTDTLNKKLVSDWLINIT